MFVILNFMNKSKAVLNALIENNKEIIKRAQ